MNGKQKARTIFLTVAYTALAIFILGHLLSGCDNPYVAPDTAKALSEQRQEGIEQRKCKAMEEQAKQLKRIADFLEKR